MQNFKLPICYNNTVIVTTVTHTFSTTQQSHTLWCHPNGLVKFKIFINKGPRTFKKRACKSSNFRVAFQYHPQAIHKARVPLQCNKRYHLTFATLDASLAQGLEQQHDKKSE